MTAERGADDALRREPAVAAIARANALGFSVSLRDLGTWNEHVRPVAELDLRGRTISVDRRVLAALAARGGTEEAARFVAAAVVHELGHAASPHAPEIAIRRSVERSTGVPWDARIRSFLLP